jgi:vancomycin resistance protein YoaR
MSTKTIPQSKMTGPADLLAQISLALAGGFLIFAAALAAFIIGYNIAYAGRIYPGVTVAGIDMSGLKPEEAVQKLNKQLTYPIQGRIVLTDGEATWVASPAQIGLQLNAQATILQAFERGRGGGLPARLTAQFRAWYHGAHLPPILIFDENVGHAYLSGIATQVDKPSIEASLSIDGLEVIVESGQVGRSLDAMDVLARIQAQALTLSDGVIPLTIHEHPPAILDASEQADIARTILSAPLTLTVPKAGEEGPGPWVFEPEDLAGMLAIERVSGEHGDEYKVGLRTETLRAMLEQISPSLVIESENARFIFNDDTRELEVIQPAVIGRTLLVEETLQLVNENLRQGEHAVNLVFDYALPDVTDDATAENLGITELVSQHTSYFYGSSGSRIQNIAVSSSRFHGVLVPPGAVFSMVEVLGDISLDSGYAEALIIYGGRTIQGVGGGVCQVSTTLFRTAFLGGFPIVERHPHAYRVSYYEQRADGSINPRLAGLDATVFVPYVDFKFRNDTDHWLLMETYVNAAARTLTWKFYSTSDGRSVEWSTTGPTHTVEPPKPVYNENPELAKGVIKQVDWAAEGADVRVSRIVYRGGEVYFSDEIFTHYLPWRAVYEYGPGTNIPDQDDD